MLRVLVVEDHPQTRAGIRAYLEAQAMDVREASNTAAALELVASWRPQVVVLDIIIPARQGESVNMQFGDGIRAARLIKEHDARIGIVFLSSYPGYLPEVLDLARQGCGGLVYLFKGERPADELREMIYAAHRGQISLDPLVSRAGGQAGGATGSLADLERERVEYAARQIAELTPRELEVVALVAAARTNVAITQELHIALSSVQTHLSNIYGKTGLADDEQGALLNKRVLLRRAFVIYQNRYAPRAP